jgi:hypothetical protein
MPARARITDERPSPGYTLHIDFTAPSFADAQLIATDLAGGLGRLRADVDTCSARVSETTEPARSQPVFCGVSGPDGERCADEPDHGGWHVESGVNGRAWSEHEPQTIRIR